METDVLLLEASILAFQSARDAGHELPECLRAVLNVAAPRDVAGPGMEIVSLGEPEPGETGPEISLRGPDNEVWHLETVALTPDIFVAAHPSGNGFVAAHARGHHQWLRHSDGDCALEVVDITAEVGRPPKVPSTDKWLLVTAHGETIWSASGINIARNGFGPPR